MSRWTDNLTFSFEILDIQTSAKLLISSFAGFYDLEHSVPISAVKGLNSDDKMVDIEFKKADGTDCHLSLRLKDVAGFI